MSETIGSTPTLDEAPPRRLVRSDEGRWLGGVCAGLGRYFDINPLVYRIAFAALSLAGGTGLLLYLAAYLVIPDEHAAESIAVEKMRTRRDQPWLLLGVGLLGFGALFALSEASFWPGNGNFWFAAVLAGAALVWWRVSSRDRPEHTPEHTAPAPEGTAPAAQAAPKPPKRPSLFAPMIGALLAASGVFGLLAALGIYNVDLEIAFAAGVVMVGAAIAIGAMTQRRVGALVLVGLVLLAAFGVAAVTPVSISAGAGDKVERPLTAVALEPSYELGLGSLDLDLRAVELPRGTTSIDASVGVGELVITVPEGVALELDAHAGAGEIDIFGELDDGFSVDRTLSVAGPTPDAPLLQLEADVGFGAIEVRRG
jgi:phage shock protein PspC (stress-responsive transcriptional regulator)